ncbi:MAG: helix-turn-helix domain-containing protein [Candidatus Planktophila sp.]|nr:helix-turn-helix domain-containing protein [Candidatus Planktophila sp.]
MPLNKYAPQVSTHRRTHSAILIATKELIATVGLANMTMIEIADTSEVSRATLYNHFRDKESVVAALCESECERLISIAQSAANACEALELLSIDISTDTALAHMRIHDPSLLTRALGLREHRLWSRFAHELVLITGSQLLAHVCLLWLMGQVLQPIAAHNSRLQAELLISRAHI